MERSVRILFAAGNGEEMDVTLPRLHLDRQYARGLLAWLRADLAELERRTARHAQRLALSSEDQGRLDAALRAMRTARAEIDRVWLTAPVPPE